MIIGDLLHYVLVVEMLLLYSSVLSSQVEIAMIAEMIHTASLIHDDVIDGSDTRRGKKTIDSKWGQKKVSDNTFYIKFCRL